MKEGPGVVRDSLYMAEYRISVRFFVCLLIFTYSYTGSRNMLEFDEAEVRGQAVIEPNNEIWFHVSGRGMSSS